MRASFRGAHERCGQARTDEKRHGVNPFDSFDITRRDFSVSGSLPREGVCSVVPSDPTDGIGAVNDEVVRFAQVTFDLDDLDVTRSGGHGKSAPQISVGSGIKLTLTREELSAAIDDIRAVRNERDAALCGAQTVQKSIELRSIDCLAAAVQRRAFDAVQMGSRGSIAVLELDPGPAAPTKTRITSVHATRTVPAAPEAGRRRTDAIRLVIHAFFAGIRNLNGRWHLSPLGRDDTAEPEGRADRSS